MDNITHRIAESIRANDFSAYQHEHYPAIQEDDAKHIYGQPIYFTDSSVRNVDFRGVKAIIEAKDCDFRGMKYDKETQFVYGSGKLAARSRFINCKLDDKTRNFLSQQGAEVN